LEPMKDDNMSKKSDKLLKSFKNNSIAPGKISPGLLKRFLDLPRKTSPALLVGPSYGEDAAVVRLGDRQVVVTSDPITFKTSRPGYYAVHINANDMAVMGAVPQYFTLTLIMPPGTTEQEAAAIMIEAIEAGDALEVVLIGGHSEVSEAVNTVVIAVSMWGELATAQPLKTSDGQPGDAIIQVGPMGIEGTSILAAEHEQALEKEFGQAFTERAAGFLLDPGLSVVAPARLAAANLDIHAMHDPTEGGLATGLREIAVASQTGLTVRQEKLLVSPETVKVCRFLKHDPLGLISSGCLLFTIAEKEAEKAVQLMTASGFPAAQIGNLTRTRGKYYLENETGRRSKLPAFAVDELAAAVGRE